MTMPQVENFKYIVVGCGLSGVTIAERIANDKKMPVLILEKRNHIGGNCYDYIDEETGILINKYGAHIFHTNDSVVWEYVNQFSEWQRWDHKVLSFVDNKYVPIPVNIDTINQLFNENLVSETDMKQWLKKDSPNSINELENSKDIAISRIGQSLYEKLIKDYTYKQWNVYPEDLDCSVLSRIPVRFNNDPRYFGDKYQALPKHGYTKFFEKILDNPLITVRLETDFFEFKKTANLDPDVKIIYTGPIDFYFSDKGLPKLQYRSIDFHIERYNMNYYQPVSVVNYPTKDNPYTRSVEYKHFQTTSGLENKTIVVFETTNDKGEPYYPFPNKKNIELYQHYQVLSENEKNVWFVGRLANYKYFNMDQAIKNSLDFYEKTLR